MFEVLFVCTGNQCRSPAAELMFRARAAGYPVRAASAGTLGHTGVPIAPTMARVLAELGLDPGSHRSRALHDAGAASVDLVIGFEQEHVAKAVVEGGGAPERTFLLTEAVSLLERLGPETAAGRRPGPGELEAIARRRVAAAHTVRVRDGFPMAPGIDDPIGAGIADMRATAQAILELCERLVRGLFGGLAPPP